MFRNQSVCTSRVTVVLHMKLKRMDTKCIPLPPAPISVKQILAVIIQEDNSLNNLDALRGAFGTRLLTGSADQAFLARHSLSMRKSCLESYTLEFLERANCISNVSQKNLSWS